MKKAFTLKVSFAILGILVAITILIFSVSFQKSRLIFCADYNRFKINVQDVSVREEELNEYIDEIRKNSAVLKKVDKNTVDNEDVVNLSCRTFSGTDIISSIDNIDVKIGTYNFNKDIEDFLIGKKSEALLI